LRRTYLVVESTADCTFCTAFLVQEVNKVFLFTSTLVCLRLLVVFGEKVKRGERGDFVLARERLIWLGVSVDVGKNTLNRW
jgi:hypothetical protein